MKALDELPSNLPTLSFHKRHLITDIVVEQATEGSQLFRLDSMRCTLGAGQWYRMASVEETGDLDDKNPIVGDVDSLTEWTFYFLNAMNTELRKVDSSSDAADGSGRRLVFSYPVPVGDKIEQLRFRVVRTRCLQGASVQDSQTIWRVQLRRVPDEVPAFSEIQYNNPLITHLLMSRDANGPGIVAITGSFANGKTTSASALFAERAMRYASEGFTIENPPEYPLSGWWEQGQISQLYLDPKVPLGDAIRSALRDSVQSFSTQTAGGVPALFFGEVSDSATAEYAITHSNDGKYVLITGHAPNTATLPQRLIDLAGPEMGADAARSAVASGLRIVIHQQLSLSDPTDAEAAGQRQINRGRLNAQLIYSPNSGSKVAEAIRANNVQELMRISRDQTAVLDQWAPRYADAPVAQRDAIFEDVLEALAAITRPSAS
jgi:Tfp pilus assembly pilus retraction ATPase PilT